MSTDEALVCWTAALTIATFILGFVAAFQDKIKNWFFKPKLEIELDLLPPASHRATAIQSLFNNIGIRSYYVYYIRFKIKNSGNISARNVEVILKDVKKRNGEHINLSLDNLMWSSLQQQGIGNYIPKVYWEYISPETYQYCNLGYIIDPQHRKLKPGEYNNALLALDDESIFAFSVYWRTPDLRYLIAKGEYSFEVKVGCENAKTITKKYKLVITGFWSEDENLMLKNGIIVTEF